MPIDRADDADGPTPTSPPDPPTSDDPSPDDEAPAGDEPVVEHSSAKPMDLAGPSPEDEAPAQDRGPIDTHTVTDEPPMANQTEGRDTPKISIEQAVGAAERNGLDLSSVDIGYEGPDTPGYTPAYGYSRFNFDGTPYVNDGGNYEVTLQDPALTSEKEAVMTIAHEMAHLTLVGPYDEEGAEAYARKVGDRFQ